jgi:mannose/cellobiose epimerase-like protein (N-acyl-D-glucosamine 2-epimerase family)
MFSRLLRASMLTAALLGPCGAEPPKAAPAQEALAPGQRWLDHFRNDLLPFWELPDAWGTPRGNFPTFRCNDGHLPSAVKPCPELAEAPAWIKENADRDFVRMKSRQTYFYGVAYHLTGDPKMLALARDGVNYLREHALEKATGSAISYWEKGVPGPPVLERTSQDLAYAQLGLAMYYYLTRDEAVLADILRLKAHIFGQYWKADWGMLRWVAQDPKGIEDQRQELVAQLDQINAYLLLLTPILPEPHRAQWKKDLVTLAHVMIEKFFAPERHLFWGTLHEPKALGSRHTDFGHTAKALWMIERIGRLVGDPKLIAFATREAGLVLQQAYLADSGSWASRLRRDGSLDINKEWWIYAELDQIAATLALQDRDLARYLPKTQDYWLRHMVDPAQHEIYGWVNGRTHEGGDGPKIHHWKSGYHSAEHALVSYVTAQALRGQPVALHFAFSMPKEDARPYFFSGKVLNREATPLAGFPDRQRVRITFAELQ